ncbi:hypothetical protein CJ030_MR1G025576 [Morella rubra]|uniref:Uncharacterized protein n=1 Tax=Morella rubra TaxID=262757 RepID=A0A6A1WN59_9ROSI|nr:hypothetical protein CJ030_MR1G025576 [Morella rubra]
MRWFLKNSGEKWRNYKCSLKHKFFNGAFTPQHVKRRHRSEAWKQSRSLQTSVHTAGSKSFARYAHNWSNIKYQNVANPNLDQVPPTIPRSSHVRRKTFAKRFTIFKPPLGDIVMRWFLKNSGEKWRNYKCSLKHKFFNGAFTPQHVKSKALTDVNLEQFCNLIDFWYSDVGRHRSEAWKQSRSLQTSVHTAGSKSFARHAHKLRRMEEIELNDLASSQTLSQSKMGGSISWSPFDRYVQEQHEYQNVANPNLDQVPPAIPRSSHVRRKTFGDNVDDEHDGASGSADGVDNAGADTGAEAAKD